MDIFGKQREKTELELKVEQLVKKAQSGETDAFGQVYDLFVDKIHKYLYFKVGKEEALDLTETVFLKAWEHLPNYRSKAGSSFSSWVFRIAHNLAIDYLKRKREPMPLEMEMPDLKSESDPRFLMERKLSEDRLRIAMTKLKPNYREILTLSYLNDLESPEVADLLGKNEGSLRVLKHRALKELKRILKELGYKE